MNDMLRLEIASLILFSIVRQQVLGQLSTSFNLPALELFANCSNRITDSSNYLVKRSETARSKKDSTAIR